MKKNNPRETVVAVCLENPFYFVLPLQQKLELIHLDPQPVFSTLRRRLLRWIKTGILRSSR